MGLGIPWVPTEDMRNFELCKSIINGASIIKAGMVDSAEKMAITQKEIASDNRKANHVDTKMMVDAILSGSSYVERGLLQIASELRYSNTLTERRDLETKIRSIEDWLFDKGFLKDFYQTAELEEKVIPLVNESYFNFLEQTCLIPLSETEANKLKQGCSDEEFKTIVQAAKNELRKFSTNMMCHPLVSLAYLITKNGLVWSNFEFGIAGTPYSWDPDYKDYKLQQRDDSMVYNFDEYQIVFKKNEDMFIADLTFKDALWHLVQVATSFEERHVYVQKLSVILGWDSFFAELNMNIAIYNLRILAQSLETFKRQKQIELLS